jgi:hypothetical protein
MLAPMRRVAGAWSVGVAMLVVASLALALWLVPSGGAPREVPEPQTARSAGPTLEAPLPLGASDGGRGDTVAPGNWAWSTEQPPADYMGEPTDAGAPPPSTREPEHEPMSPVELARRQRQTVAFLERQMADLERQATRAEQGGDDERAGMLGRRRERLRARRDELARVLEGP